ncbi:Protein CBR-STR-245 [Caenorhabditis briggsae]|uniref:Serpentine receptor class r-10 n=1 Tax=Caenorhabditis briggsae TaxID=6238 RepID=A8XWH6_CAEBR|nr:Protein CBR-STR-245 [Caenorhabditis briggsae]CAP36995.1 Protein CBR-STR-245 [Caenorhabditis briggsae]
MFPSFFSYVERIAAIFAIIGNLVLICLVMKKSVSKFGNYRYLMVYISVYEILFAILHGLTVPVLVTTDCWNFLVMRVDKTCFFQISKPFLQFLNVLFCNMFGMSMSLFANHFIYRYMVLSRSKALRDSDGRTIIFMVLFSIVFGVVWGLLAWDTMQPFPEADQMVNERFAIPMGLSLDQIAYVGVLFYTKDANGNSLVHWPSVVGIGIQSVFIGISITTILIFGFKCYQETHKISMNASQSKAKIQSELFYALVFQTLIPICLIHIPASIVYAVAAMDQSNEYYGQFLSISVCLYPALDPLPNFFIIKDYKKAIRSE